jgi:hypothetical protein
MKEIKFRVWDKDAKKMIYLDLGNINPHISRLHVALIGYDWFDEQAEPMQFTGFLDKNGKEGFDGDLAKLSDATYSGIYEIRFNNGRWELHSEDENGNPNTEELYSWKGKFEVIGNIYIPF